MIFVAIILIGLLLAYSNGANDNFKGVATLLGSRTTSYRRALLWAAATTALGSVAAVVFARQLLVAFSGKGLVPPTVVADP
ncbi:MAG: inorganic phosphate transporter, partial [Candidatus Krumholzibacteria bacterium]|nr:inorganic phosphate transporter [Candidatus Krumholzibacteria bacterium]